MRNLTRMVFAAVLVLGRLAAATTYHVDPAKGASDGDGSAQRPWKTLEEIIGRGLLKQIKGGDTILLKTGYHGAAVFSGDNASTVTIAATEGQRPTLSRLTISSGSNWCVRGLVISPAFGSEPYKGSIVSFGEAGDSSRICVEDCYIFTAEDSSKWDAKQWMAANSGVNVGRHGRELTLRNNFIRNTRFGVVLAAPDSLCEGNIVSDFSADGIRATRDGLVIQHNIIKNVYVSAADGDDNHDDGIQCFLFNKDTGTVRGVSTLGNIIIAHEDPHQKWPNSLQGIGYFDGPLVDFAVADNVINVDAWHGIALYDAQNARVERNIVWTPEGVGNRAWIMFGDKQKLAKDNIARNNFANAFKLKQPGTVAENNQRSTAAIYEEALKKARKVICDKFGEKHFAADRDRLTLEVRHSSTRPTANP